MTKKSQARVARRQARGGAIGPKAVGRQPWSHPALEPAAGRLRRLHPAEPWLALGLLAVYAASRAWGLSAFPVHYDEASYLHWSQLVSVDWSQRFIMAAWGGKQPLFFWIAALFNKLIPDALVAGRLVPLLSGALTLAGVWLTANHLLGRRTAWLSAGLCLVLPYLALYDRVAIIDGFATCLAIWTLYVSLRLHESPWFGVPLALLAAAALLTKTTNLLYLPLVALGPLAAAEPRAAYRRALPPMLIAGVAGYILYWLLFGGTEGARMVAAFEQQRDYNFTLGELLRLPIAQWWTNGLELGGFAWELMTPLLGLAATAGAVWALAWRRPAGLLLAAWAFVLIGAYVALSKTGAFARYYVASMPLLMILAAAGALRVALWAGERPIGAAWFEPVRAWAAGSLALAAALLLAVVAAPAAWRTAGLALRPAVVLTQIDARADEMDLAIAGHLEMKAAVLERARAAGACNLLTHWLYFPARDLAYTLFAHEPLVQMWSVVALQNGQAAYTGDQFAVVNTATGAVAPPGELAQAPCTLYVLDEATAVQVGYADALGLVDRFESWPGGATLGLYQLRFDARFVGPGG